MRELTLFSAGGVAPPLVRIAEMFEAERGVRVRHYNGRPEELIGIIEQEGRGDLISLGAEFIADLLVEKGLVRHDDRHFIGTRRLGICVRAGNPLNIRTFDDMFNPGIRIGVACQGCLTGVWETVALLADPIRYTERRNAVSARADSCGRLVSLLLGGTVDAIMGWNTFVGFRDRDMEFVSFPPELQIPRATNISILAGTVERDLAEDFCSQVMSGRGLGVYEDLGWHIPSSIGEGGTIA